ncbi:hypothetical protein BJD55_gp017 [Gordonia phage Yvonnetastic]|uniref:Uncharacterized protein n=1 Tax=Gordonia phage Yvonnetastic TaxID=1821566 RepID=A0A142K8Y3_9CAUD|nr:hypothetical protein BJD55_gp017 [Gordonia phage Yvonnetastic]AMS02566.1 hypothetical protein SEA_YVONNETASTIC_17 [Gordonia phage Yvonnetastic]
MGALAPEQVDEAVLKWYRNLVDEADKKYNRQPRHVDLEDAWSCLSYQTNPVEIEGLGEVCVEEDFDEEFHTNRYLVVRVGSSLHYKRCGWRASHDGSYLDGPTVQVRPLTKTVTYWETNK